MKSPVAIMILLALLLSDRAMGAMSRDEAVKVFQESNVAMRRANDARGDEQLALSQYAQAIAGYQRLIEEGGIRNSRLYCNLANGCLLSGDVGRAVLNYRRAQMLSPGDAEIRRNLAYARSQRVDQIEPPAQKRMLRTLAFWHNDFSLRSRLLAAAVSLGLLGAAATAMVWLGRRSWLVVPAVTAAVVFGAAAGSAAVEQWSRRIPAGVIVAEETIARQGDSLSYSPAFAGPLHSGTEFILRRQRDGWLQIELADGSTGWIEADTAELI